VRFKSWRIQGTPLINTKVASDAAELQEMNRLLHPELVAAATAPVPEQTRGLVPTVREFIKRFLEEYAPDGKPGSARARRVHLRGSITRALGDLRLDEIRQHHINAFIASHKGRAAQTIRNKLYALSALLNYAADCELIPRHSLNLTVRGASETKIEATPAPDVKKLLKVAKDPRWRVALLLASEDGLRIGEIRGAQWTDIKGETITIRRAIDDRNQLGAPKHNRIRTVPLSPATLAALKKLPKRGLYLITRLDDSEQGRKGQKRASGPAGFVGYSGMVKVIKRLYREAKLGEPGDDISPWHSLRHAYGTKLAAANVPLSVIQQLMGHADIRTTMRYVTTTAEQMAAAVSKTFR
jgi:integrase